jgi:hypothetical protein
MISYRKGVLVIKALKNLVTKSKEIYDMSVDLADLGVPVQKSWLFVLPWKMQTVVNQGLRAPDTHYCEHVKNVCRWLRAVVLCNADDDHTFMCRQEKLPVFLDLQNELNYCSMHFTTHFFYSLEIVAYKHPNKEVRDIAFGYYSNIVEGCYHFNLETEKELDIRLSDKEEAQTLGELVKTSKEADKPPKVCPAYDPYTP